MFHTSTGNSAEDEQNNKRHAKKYRVYLIVLAIWVAMLLNLFTILTPILVMQRNDSRLQHEYQNQEKLLANALATNFRDAILEAIAAVYGVEGYVMGMMKSLPKLDTSAAERMEGQSFPKLYDYTQLLASTSKNVDLFATAPGGVILQVYPIEEELHLKGLDFFKDTASSLPLEGQTPLHRRDLHRIIRTGNLTLIGPYRKSDLTLVNGVRTSKEPQDGWWVEILQPIYNATPDATISKETFWGFGMVLLSADRLMSNNGFPHKIESEDMDFVIYTGDDFPNECRVMLTSAKFTGETECSAPPIQDFLSDATTRDVLRVQISWKIALKSKKRVNKLTSGVRNVIISSSVVCVSILLALCIFAIVRCTKVYDGTLYAPRMSPFAMLTIGPRRGEELWDLAADQMVEVTERLSRVLTREMVRHHAYQIQQVHPLTTSYVTRSVATAVQMAFSIIEELHNAPIDDPLRRLLGDDGSLLISYAVHWCTDATVHVEVAGGGYRYEGPDVTYGGRMWLFAAPGVVTVSPAALPSAARISHVKSKLFDSVFLRGVMTRQDLYIVTDTSNHRLKEAEIFATHQVRRARQAQLQYTTDKRREQSTESNSSSSTSTSNHTHRNRRHISMQRSGHDSTDLDGSSVLERVVVTPGADVASPGTGSCSESSVHLRCRTSASAAASKRATYDDGCMGVCGVPTAIVVPATTTDIPLTGKAVEMETVDPSVSFLQPASAATTPPLTNGTLRSRRGQHTNGCAVAVAHCIQHPELLPINPLVVVPPSTTVATVGHRLSGGASGGVVSGSASASASLSSDESLSARHGNALPACANDNPLAHDMNVIAVATRTGAVVGNTNGPTGEGGRCVTGNTLYTTTSPNNSDSDSGMQRSELFMDNLSSDLLLRPAISAQSDVLLRSVFDRHAVALDVSYDSVRVLVYYFYFSYKILFRPLAAPELHNIYRRLMASFGVPHQGILENLAARCAIRFLQRHEERQTLLWDQQHRLQAHTRLASASTSPSSDSDSGTDNTQ